MRETYLFPGHTIQGLKAMLEACRDGTHPIARNLSAMSLKGVIADLEDEIERRESQKKD